MYVICDYVCTCIPIITMCELELYIILEYEPLLIPIISSDSIIATDNRYQ
jgi:hypothetical protein